MHFQVLRLKANAYNYQCIGIRAQGKPTCMIYTNDHSRSADADALPISAASMLFRTGCDCYRT